MTTGRPSILARLLIVALFSGATPVAAKDAAPAAGTYKSCTDELRERGIIHGDPRFGDESVACGQRRREQTRAGVYGRGPQVVALCREELQARGLNLGSARGDEAHRECVQRTMRELESGSGPDRAKAPFGSGGVLDYLNAIVADDLDTMHALDRRYLAAVGAPVPASGGRSRPMMVGGLASTYIALYPRAYARCLEPDAPTVTVGRVYDEVKRDGRGIEISRRTVDERRQVRVNRRLYALATRMTLEPGSDLGDRMFALFGADAGELSAGNQPRAVTADGGWGRAG